VVRREGVREPGNPDRGEGNPVRGVCGEAGGVQEAEADPGVVCEVREGEERGVEEAGVKTGTSRRV